MSYTITKGGEGQANFEVSPSSTEATSAVDITVTPNKGYEFKNPEEIVVKVSDSPIELDTDYSITKSEEDDTVSIVIKQESATGNIIVEGNPSKKTYSVAKGGEGEANFSINKSSITHGEELVITLTCTQGYNFTEDEQIKVKINNELKEKDTDYTITMDGEGGDDSVDVTIKAVSALGEVLIEGNPVKKVYTISKSGGSDNFTIDKESVNHGDALVLNITSSQGYTFTDPNTQIDLSVGGEDKEVSVDFQLSGKGDKVILSAAGELVTGNLIVTGNPVKKVYTISKSGNSNNFDIDTKEATHGEQVAVKVTCKDGYTISDKEFLNVKVGEDYIKETSGYTISPETGNEVTVTILNDSVVNNIVIELKTSPKELNVIKGGSGSSNFELRPDKAFYKEEIDITVKSNSGFTFDKPESQIKVKMNEKYLLNKTDYLLRGTGDEVFIIINENKITSDLTIEGNPSAVEGAQPVTKGGSYSENFNISVSNAENEKALDFNIISNDGYVFDEPSSQITIKVNSSAITLNKDYTLNGSGKIVKVHINENIINAPVVVEANPSAEEDKNIDIKVVEKGENYFKFNIESLDFEEEAVTFDIVSQDDKKYQFSLDYENEIILINNKTVLNLTADYTLSRSDGTRVTVRIPNLVLEPGYVYVNANPKNVYKVSFMNKAKDENEYSEKGTFFEREAAEVTLFTKDSELLEDVKNGITVKISNSNSPKELFLISKDEYNITEDSDFKIKINSDVIIGDIFIMYEKIEKPEEEKVPVIRESGDIIFRKLYDDEDITIPAKSTEGSIGYDIKAYLKKLYAAPSIDIKPGDIKKIPTGLQVDIPKTHELQVRSRSGLALKGLIVTNSPGTIDCDYRGEIFILVGNVSKNTITINEGDRVAQVVPLEVASVKLREYSEDSDSGTAFQETKRGRNGFGSTGL